MELELFVLEMIVLLGAWWLGLYLLARDAESPSMRFAGLGLAIYSLALAVDLLSESAPNQSINNALVRLGWSMLFLPAIFWFGAIFFLLPEDDPQRRRLGYTIDRSLIPAAFVIYAVAVNTDLVLILEDNVLEPGPLFPLFAGLLVLLLLVSLALVIRTFLFQKQKQAQGVILAATIFFGLGMGLVLFALTEVPEWFLIPGIGFDLIILGLSIAFLDAFDQGEAFLPDFIRSLATAAIVLLIFGGQVALAMMISTGLSFTMLILFLAVSASAIALVIFLDPVQSVLDKIVFRRKPQVHRIREDSRILAAAAPRSLEMLDPEDFDDAQLRRLTRRALSHMGHLPKLAASPLTRMALVDSRFEANHGTDSTLERAAELKTILKESIGRLKPRTDADFGITDEWRYYNSLYFPYVIGLKPYSRRADQNALDSTSKAALDWFRRQVPERTLYNWQNAAAALIAQDLREQNRVLKQSNWQ